MTWQSPYSKPGHWYKTALHIHTTRSDGTATPEEAITWYSDHGFDAITLTDHWVLSPASQAGEPGPLLLAGTEFDGPGYHMVALGLTDMPERALGKDPSALAQWVRSHGGVPFIAHPYWTGETSEHIAGIEDVVGVEVYNSVCDAYLGLGYSNITWDELLSRGKHLWGFAVDDVHWHEGSLPGQGWVMVRSQERTQSAFLQAITAGDFYATQGPVISDLRIVRNESGQRELTVQCSPCRRIVFHGQGPTGRAFDRRDASPLTSASYALIPEQRYLRVACMDDAGKWAWSQPVFVEDALKGEIA